MPVGSPDGLDKPVDRELTFHNESDSLLNVAAEDGANPGLDAPVRDEISDAWMLAVADAARQLGQERVHVWLASGQVADVRRTGPADQPVAWFAPTRAVAAQTADGRDCEAQVETAVVLGLPRWSPGNLPPQVSSWFVRLHPMGLALHDPSGQVFARGNVEVSTEWTSAALVAGVLAVYGVADPGTGPEASAPVPQRLIHARRAGLIAAAYVPLHY